MVHRSESDRQGPAGLAGVEGATGRAGGCTCGTMSLIMRCDLIVKSSLLIMSPFGLIIRTMSQQ